MAHEQADLFRPTRSERCGKSERKPKATARIVCSFSLFCHFIGRTWLATLADFFGA